MTTAQLVSRLHAVGVELWLDGGKLKYRAPAGALTPELRRELSGRTADLLLFVQSAKAASAAARPVISPAPRDRALELSFAQQRLWFLNQLAPNSAFYNIPSALRLRGPLDRGALQRALNALVARHESLRTTFKGDSQVAHQIVHPATGVNVETIDLTHLAGAEREAEAQRINSEQGLRPYDLANGPLFRVMLLLLSDQDHVLLVNMHHIIADGWSLGVFNRDLRALYEANRRDASPSLAPLPVQYADFAAWQRQSMRGETLESLLDYWRSRLAGLTTLRLSTDRPRPVEQTYRGGFESFTISKELTHELHALSKSAGATLFMTMLAAFKVLLARYTRQEDIVVGSPIANRNRAEIEGLIGFFVNMLVLRTDVSGDPAFRELLGRVREAAMGAYDHQDLPFEKLVEELAPQRDLGRNPLFQVTFAVQNAPDPGRALDGLSISSMPLDCHSTRFDLEVHVFERDEALQLLVIYSTDLFDKSTIQRLVSHYAQLLESVVATPDAAISRLNMTSPAERRKLLEDFNQTSVDHPLDACIHTHVETAAARWPDAVAVAFNDDALTFRELNERANQLAHRLRAWGVGPDVLVGLLMNRSLEMVVAMLAVLKAGGAYVPLDPTHPQSRLEFMLADAKCPVILTQSAVGVRLILEGVRVLRVDSDFTSLNQEPTTNLIPLGSSESLAYVLYTSGSTGKPKGVAISHRALCNHMLWMARVYPLTHGDRVLQKTPFTFDASVWEFYAPLMAGARLVMAKPDGHTDPDYLIRTINKERVSVLQLVPSQLRMLIETGRLGTCRTLRQVFCGGEPLPMTLASQCHEATGASVHNLYGPTEATIDTTHWTFSPDETRATAPIGRPIDNVRAYILDSHLEPVPIGAPGELHLSGHALGRGYVNQPQLTAKKFITNPFSRGDATFSTLYRTGDLCRYRADGNIEFLGRVDDQVKLRGFRIELGEIEAALNEQLGVAESAVVVHNSDGGADRLIAYIVPKKQTNGTSGGSATPSQGESDLVGKWRHVHDETVRQSGQSASTAFNIIGWNSSYTGAPIPAHEMREWVDQTVARILSLKPDRVLEIGCGTGLLLAQIAPHCRTYHATDFSDAAIGHVHRLVASQPELRHVALSCCEADQVTGIVPNSIDTVILNSVVQYFPSIDYLRRVIDRALDVLAPGGRIFIGDVRSLPLLKAFHASVQEHRATAEMTRAQLNGLIDQAIEHEEELVLSPWFFESLRDAHPRICEVEVLYKRGGHHNELSRFRVDAVLHADVPGEVSLQASEHDWLSDRLSVKKIEQLLAARAHPALIVRNVPNERLAPMKALLDWLGDGESIATLKERSPTDSSVAAIDPESICRLGERFNCRAEIGVSRDGAFDAFDVMFVSAARHKDRQPLFCRQTPGRTKPALSNDPMKAKAIRDLVPKLRDHLRARLPEYMAPSAYVVLDSLPHNASGKVDRRALPAPLTVFSKGAGEYAAPTTEAQRAVADIWGEVLEIGRIGIHDNFFELGGHSLLATQVVSRIRNHFRVDVPLKDLFECPTVSALAERVGAMAWAVNNSAAALLPVGDACEEGSI